MSGKRKPRPTRIYREEIHGAGLYNSTRQTFDEKAAELWRNLPDPPWPGSTRVILVGRIEWDAP